MNEKIEHAEITSMLHSCYFGLENAHNKLTGSGHRAVIPEVAKMLPHILAVKGEVKFDENMSLDGNMQQLQDYFNNEEFFDMVKMQKLNDNKFLFQIDGCFLAKSGVHEILKPDKNSCMFAHILASLIHIKTGKTMRINSSEFTESGSKTIIETV